MTTPTDIEARLRDLATYEDPEVATFAGTFLEAADLIASLKQERDAALAALGAVR